MIDPNEDGRGEVYPPSERRGIDTDSSGEICALLRKLVDVEEANNILLRQCLTGLRELYKLGAKAASGAAAPQQSKQAQTTGYTTAQLALDTEKGNPRIKYDPRSWKGPTMVGKRFSDCPPEYLDMTAENARWQADNPRVDKETGIVNENDQKNAKWKRLDAARAEAWAARIRSGAVKHVPTDSPSGADAHAPNYDD